MVWCKCVNALRSFGHSAPGTALPDQVWLTLRYLSVHFSSLIPSLEIPDSVSYTIPRVHPMLWNGLWNINSRSPSEPANFPASIGMYLSVLCIPWHLCLNELLELQRGKAFKIINCTACISCRFFFTCSFCVRGKTDWPDSCTQNSTVTIHSFP